MRRRSIMLNLRSPVPSTFSVTRYQYDDRGNWIEAVTENALEHAQSPVAGSEHFFRYSLDPIPPIIVLIARLCFPVPLAAFLDDASGVLVSLFDYVALLVVAKRRPVHPKPVVGGVRHRLHVGGDASAVRLPWRRWRVHGYRLRAYRCKQRVY